jgi:hypothetical protein
MAMWSEENAARQTGRSEARGLVDGYGGGICEFLTVELLGLRVVSPLQIASIGRRIDSPWLHLRSDRFVGRGVLRLDTAITD